VDGCFGASSWCLSTLSFSFSFHAPTARFLCVALIADDRWFSVPLFSAHARLFCRWGVFSGSNELFLALMRFLAST